MGPDRTLQQLKAIHEVQSRYFEKASASEIFDALLESLLELTESEYGFIGEVRHREDGTPYLKTHAITNVAWSDETLNFYEENAPAGLEFNNLDSLFGAVLVTGEPVIANDPDGDARSGGRPEGHPELRAFLGMPMHTSAGFVGMFGVANRDGGYDDELVSWIEPLTTTIGNLVHAFKAARLQQETEAALERSEFRFRRLWEGPMMGVAILTSDGQIVEANDLALELLGRETDALPIAWQETLPDDAADSNREIRNQLERDGFVFGHRRDLVRPSGETIPISLGVTPLDERSYLIFLRDMSDQQQLEAQIREAQKMEAIGRLSGSIAHDFNNLLMVIGGNADTWLEHEPCATDQHPATQILDATQQASDLVAQLVAFSRGRTVDPIEIDLNGTLRLRLSMLRRLLREEITLEFDLDPALPSIEAAPSEVDQVLLNLTANARDAIATHGSIRVETRTLAGSHPGALLRFRDDGQGMDAATRDRIFEPLFTTKDGGRGSGLGLATVYSILTRGGGTISVDSTPGRGTTFELFWPAANPHRRNGAPQDPGAQSTTQGKETPLRILLVEDEPGIRAVARKALLRAGHDVTEAADGLEALELAEGEAYDVLVSDVVMPRQRGPELLTRLRVSNPKLSAVFVSGNVELLESAASEASENVRVLQKPFRIRQLLNAIAEVAA